MQLNKWLCILSTPLLRSTASGSDDFPQAISIIQGQALENLAIRSNGDVLVTVTTAPNLYSICPIDGTSTLIHTFPNATGLLGITETSPDVFHAVVGDFSLTDQNYTSSWSIWKIDYASGKHGITVFSKDLDVPGAGLLNGMTTFNAERGLLLVADFLKRRVLRIDLMNKTSSVACSDPLLGLVNGLHVHDSELYFTNYQTGNFTGKVALDADGIAKGDATELPGSGGFEVDDFCFDDEGNIYGADSVNAVVEFKAPEYGTSKLVAAVPGTPSAAKIGRTVLDNRCLYVTTDSGTLYGVEIGGTGSCPQPSR